MKIRKRPQVALIVETSRSYGRNLLGGIASDARTRADWALLHREMTIDITRQQAKGKIRIGFSGYFDNEGDDNSDGMNFRRQWRSFFANFRSLLIVLYRYGSCCIMARHDAECAASETTTRASQPALCNR